MADAQPCYPLSRKQLRVLWDFDNELAHEVFGIPLRRCSKLEDYDECAHINDKAFDEIKTAIQQMWHSSAVFFEFFEEKENPHLGFRLRVRKDVPCRINFSAKDSVIMGWTSAAPLVGPCAHLYNRSPIGYMGYMGGPVSYCNWDGKNPTVSISKSYKGPLSFHAYCKASNLRAGTELTWDYGSKKSLPEFPNWFLAGQCCFVEPEKRSESLSLRRSLPRTVQDLAYSWKEMCSLCGQTFMTEKSKRLQRKPHYVDSHANYFGSDWDGSTEFNPKVHKIDGQKVLMEAEFLNTVISHLHSLNWRVIPACKVLTESEHSSFTSSSDVMELFRRKCSHLKEGGTLVLRGGSAPSCVEHLSPIPVCRWKHLTWVEGTQPQRGRYSTTGLASHDYFPQDRVMELAIQLISA